MEKEKIEKKDFKSLSQKQLLEFQNCITFIARSKFFTQNTSDGEEIKKNTCAISNNNVMAIFPKDYLGEKIISNFWGEGNIIDMPKLDYSQNVGNVGVYCIEYLDFATNLLKKVSKINYEEGIKISLGKDYPITLENYHLKIIIAPRFDEE